MLFPKPVTSKKPRKPLKRTAFARRDGPSVQREKKPAALTERHPLAPKAVMALCLPTPPQPKREYIRSPALLAAVRKLPCQHCGRTQGVQASHSNQGAHGKGKGIKADDNRIAALCAACHLEVDQGSKLSGAERLALWTAAHVKTVREVVRRGEWPQPVPIPDLREFH